MVSTNHFLSALALFSVSPRNMPPLRDDASTDDDHRRHNIKLKPTISSSSSNYGAQMKHPTTYDDNPTFKGPLILDRRDSTDMHRVRIHHHYLENERLKNTILNDETKLSMPTTKLGQATPTATILKLIVDHLARKEAPVDVKEVAESVEFYLRCGKRLIGAAKRVLQTGGGRCDDFVNTITIQDLCSGHGLTGLIFLACNPPGKLLSNNKTILLQALLTDQIEPQSHSLLKDCIAEICPWIAEAGVVTFTASSLKDFTANAVQEWSKKNSDDTTSSNSKRHQATIIVSTHACGSLTDEVLQYAMNVQAASLAVMPCCYTGTDSGVPYGVRRMLGVGMSADVRRCFELKEYGYHTDLAAIPRAVTAMNRIIVAERRR